MHYLKKGHSVQLTVFSKNGRNHTETKSGVVIKKLARRHASLWILGAFWDFVRADIVHIAQNCPRAFPLLMVRKLLKRPFFYEFADWDGIGGFASLSGSPHLSDVIGKLQLTFFEEYVPRICTAVIAISRNFQKRALAMGLPQERVHYIPGTADTRQFHPSVSGSDFRARSELKSKFVIGYIGRISSGIEWKKIIDAVALLKKDLAPVLLFVGEDHPRIQESVLGYAREWGADILWIGRVDRNEIPRWMAACDVLWALYSTEYPYVLMNLTRTCTKLFEYMAMGKPIVATDIGEIREVLKDGAGLLVTSRTDDICRALLSLYQNPELRKNLSEIARARAASFYSSDVLAENLLAIYGRIVSTSLTLGQGGRSSDFGGR
jgi:glycosyltransferase involved in cell wall biosynthesis